MPIKKLFTMFILIFRLPKLYILWKEKNIFIRHRNLTTMNIVFICGGKIGLIRSKKVNASSLPLSSLLDVHWLETDDCTLYVY